MVIRLAYLNHMMTQATPTTHPWIKAGDRITSNGYVYECTGTKTTKAHGTRLMFANVADRRGGPGALYLPADAGR
jgi:hypothetical protein